MKKIGNVGLLDLTEVKPEVLEEIDAVGNVGVMIFTEETEGSVIKLSIGNLGASIKVPKGSKVIQGDFELSHEYFEHNQSPSFLVEGSLRIKADVVKEDIEKIGCLYVHGFVICPESLIADLQAKADRIDGPIIPWMENARLLKGNVTLAPAFLKAMQKPTALVVVGRLDLTVRMNIQLLEKISVIHAIGKVTIREEYYRELQAKLRETNRAKLTIIPEGYEYLKQPLFLDTTVLKQYSHAKLYALERIHIEDDVTPDMLRKHIGAIHTEDIIICREELREIVMRLCENAAVRILFYEQGLMVVEDQRDLTKAVLKHQPAPFSLVVFGRLDISDDVDPKELLSRLEYVDNFGKILANEELCGTLQSKIRTREGALINKDQRKPENKETPEDYLVENVGYFKL
jgi:hypothetical protein